MEETKNKLDELIKETDYSAEEWNVFQKVEKNNQLQDLKNTLDEMLTTDRITIKQYDFACENADWIIDKYNDYETDWQTAMEEAIYFVTEEE